MSCSQEEIQQFIKAQENKNTAKKTNSNMTTLAKWLEQNRGETRPLQSIPPHRLNSHLCKFFMDARKSNGENYEPSSLKGMLSSFNRHLREHNYAYCLIRSEEFAQLNMVIASKQVELKRSGRGNRPRKADCLTEDEVDRLYSSGQLGSHTPEALLHTVWFNNTIYFGMRGVQEHHEMKWGDLKVKQDGNGYDYVAFCERSTKTRGGADPNNIRQVEPKMWATKENPERCPVRMFKKYFELRPTHYMKETDPFYISTCTDMNKSKKWFRGQPISGHKNVQSLNDYSSLNSNQHRTISKIIGGQAKRPKSTQGPVSPLPDPVSTMVSSQMSRTSSEQRESHTVNVSRGVDPVQGMFNNVYGGTYNITVNYFQNQQY
ncbi:zinc finger MYM-type protein 2-like [Haliotis rufescens]|uniref:zinc finger MYM-type protein 2-like n=1 Tax=Haliotis rufescens TaxID=6454 RepID=UPI00201EFACB|nr:zinc finger MYM-type protein 2-like [Haliotis rufescens]